MRADADAEFTAYAAQSAARLRRTAYLLCGDWQRAEDELQAALVKLYLSWHRVRARGALDVAAGLAVPGHPYLNIQVTPQMTMSTATPTGAELSDLASGSGDGYYGPCSVQRLSDGSILVVRSGETKQGHFTMAQATLIRPDGSGVFAEDTNQAMASVRDVVKEKEQAKSGKPALPPVVSARPPVNASTLAAFVRDVAARS